MLPSSGYLVLYPEEGSIAEKSVKTLLNSVDFTFSNLDLDDKGVYHKDTTINNTIVKLLQEPKNNGIRHAEKS